jgi:ABC-type transport system involved in multi-copper enzyme maturation permease subunit
MIPAIKSELRKVFTVRSTYVILLLVLALEVFFAFYSSGWHIDAADLHNPDTLANDVTAAVNVVAVFGALIAVLLFSHEYRYNTIMHTLTLSNSRSKVLFAKIFVITCTILSWCRKPYIMATYYGAVCSMVGVTP